MDHTEIHIICNLYKNINDKSNDIQHSFLIIGTYFRAVDIVDLQTKVSWKVFSSQNKKGYYPAPFSPFIDAFLRNLLDNFLYRWMNLVLKGCMSERALCDNIKNIVILL